MPFGASQLRARVVGILAAQHLLSRSRAYLTPRTSIYKELIWILYVIISVRDGRTRISSHDCSSENRDSRTSTPNIRKKFNKPRNPRTAGDRISEEERATSICNQCLYVRAIGDDEPRRSASIRQGKFYLFVRRIGHFCLSMRS